MFPETNGLGHRAAVGWHRLAGCFTLVWDTIIADVGVEDGGALGGAEVFAPHLRMVLGEPGFQGAGAALVVPEAEGGDEAGEVADFFAEGLFHMEHDLSGREASDISGEFGFVDDDLGIEQRLGCDIP